MKKIRTSIVLFSLILIAEIIHSYVLLINQNTEGARNSAIIVIIIGTIILSEMEKKDD